MKINNENEKHYISCFHTNSLHIKFSWIHVMGNIIKIMYQLMRRQETLYKIIGVCLHSSTSSYSPDPTHLTTALTPRTFFQLGRRMHAGHCRKR